MYRKRSTPLMRVILYLAILIVTIWAFFPFYWFITTSFKFPRDVMETTWIPFFHYQPTLNNWREQIIHRWPEISLGLKNSLTVALFTCVLAVLIGSLAAYSLARFTFKRWTNKNIIIFFLSQRMLPPVVLIIPFLIMMKAIKLVDTQMVLILVNTVVDIPFVVLIMRDVFKGIPVELEEAALVDGCSRSKVFYQISLPLAAPGLIAAGILCFALTWNEFMFALTLVYQKALTIPVQILGTDSTQGIQYWDTSVRGLIAILPPAILALFVQRFIVRGLTLGAVKG